MPPCGPAQSVGPANYLKGSVRREQGVNTPHATRHLQLLQRVRRPDVPLEAPSSSHVNIVLFVRIRRKMFFGDPRRGSAANDPAPSVRRRALCNPARGMVWITEQSVSSAAWFVARPCTHPAMYQTTLRICSFCSQMSKSPLSSCLSGNVSLIYSSG